MVRKIRSVTTNEVEMTRFHVQMALYYRAVWRVTSRFIAQMSQATPYRAANLSFDVVDRAAELTTIFAGLRENPPPGTDIDIRGRVSFPFFVDCSAANTNKGLQVRDASPDTESRSVGTLIVVLDPTDLFIVTPLAKHDFKRGTVVCCVPLLNVIAAATDGEWLHVAVRHNDVGLLIKNGNMALRFDTPGTAVVVRQYVDRSRQVLRGELVRKIKHLFDVQSDAMDEATSAVSDTHRKAKSDCIDGSRIDKNIDKPSTEEGFNEDKKEIDPSDVGNILLNQEDVSFKEEQTSVTTAVPDETPAPQCLNAEQ
jgi:hypothetical protein